MNSYNFLSFLTIITSMITNLAYLLKWYGFITIIGFIVLPLTFHLFRRIPDKGYSVIKVVGLLLVGFFHWIFNSLGLSQNSSGGIWGVVLFLFVLSFWVSRKNGLMNIRAWIKANGKLIIITELIFLVAFLGMAWLRAYNPNILGTEKPMELMFINSILRSPIFPPHDAWLAGYSISYYYFGYVMVAILAMVTSTPAGVAFNLAIALIFALTFVSAFGVLLNLIARFNFRRNEPLHLIKLVPVSLVAPVVLLLVGNFYGVLDVLHNHHIFADFNVPTIWFQTGSINSETQTTIPPQVMTGKINFWEWMDLKQLGPIEPQTLPFQGIEQGNWFFASRTIHDRNLMGYDPEAIDEFPAFSFLLSDLHPHVLGLPFVILVILLCFEWLLDLREIKEEDSTQPITWDRIGFSSIILGSLIFLNTWDFPIYAFLFLLSGFIAYSHHHERLNVKELWQFFRPILWVILIGVLLYVPFLISFQSQAGGIIPNAIYPTKLRQSLVMFGPLIFGFISLLIAVLRKHKSEVDYKTGWKVTLAFLALMIVITSLLIGVILTRPDLAGVLNSAISPFTINQAVGLLLLRRLVEGGTLLLGLLLLAGCVAILWGLRRTGSESVLFIFVMALTGTLLLLGPEFVYLRDNFGWRMNTLFKFYFQVWILWALTASFGVWYLLKQVKGWGRSIALIVTGLGFLAGFVYTLGTTQVTTSSMRTSAKNNAIFQPTLDGLAYYAITYPDDWALIEWINTNVDTSDVVLEGTKGAYWVEGRSSRVAMMTGLQTVIGWVNHESQWRGEEFVEFAGREADVQTIYTTREWELTEQLLDQYHVKYVVVSPLERDWYGSIQQAKFDQHMQRVFEYGDYVVYGR